MAVTGGVSHGEVPGTGASMAVVLRQSRRFDAASPVTRYWLANCVGFSLAGGGRGRVERIFSDGDPHDPSLLEVRTRSRRVRRVPASAVVAVVPAERLLVVGHRRRRVARNRKRSPSPLLHSSARVLKRVLAAGAGVVAVGAWLVAAFAAALLRQGRRAWLEGSPVVARTGRRAGSETARLVRSVPWQSYGRSARSATTQLSRAASNRWSHLRTTSSGRRSEKSSADEARTTSST
jgi:hypothetical protein